MTKEQAIERIERAIKLGLRDPYDHQLSGRLASLAWNEMKAIAREGRPATTLYMPPGSTDDDVKAALDLLRR